MPDGITHEEVHHARRRYPVSVAAGERRISQPRYARVIPFRFLPGELDRVVSLVREVVLPAAVAQPGFASGLWLTDPATG